MSLVTTCPDCGTSFKVRPEHLVAHRGDVRCGNCDFIFNAFDHLAETPSQEEHTLQQALEELLEPSVKSSGIGLLDGVTGGTADEPAPFEEVDFELETEPMQATKPQDEELVLQNSENEASPLSSALEADSISEPEVIEPEPPEIKFPAGEHQGTTQVAEPEPIPGTEHEAGSLAHPEPEPERDIPSQPTPIIQQEPLNPKSKRSTPAWRTGILVLLLLAVVAGQCIYSMRTQIAVLLPPAKPYLVKFCDIAGCIVDLPRQSDLLVIDDSDLRQDVEHEDVIILSTTIINHASFAQAYPLLEVTLTDVDDRALLRRVYQPHEYLPKDTEAKIGIAAGGEMLVRLHLATGGLKAAGYRVYVMYQ